LQRPEGAVASALSDCLAAQLSLHRCRPLSKPCCGLSQGALARPLLLPDMPGRMLHPHDSGGAVAVTTWVSAAALQHLTGTVREAPCTPGAACGYPPGTASSWASCGLGRQQRHAVWWGAAEVVGAQHSQHHVAAKCEVLIWWHWALRIASSLWIAAASRERRSQDCGSGKSCRLPVRHSLPPGTPFALDRACMPLGSRGVGAPAGLAPLGRNV
jgi:hypothetical protein